MIKSIKKLAALLPLFFQLNCGNNPDPDASLSAGQNQSHLEESINEAQYYINEAINDSRTPDFYVGQALSQAAGENSSILNSEVFHLVNRNGKQIFYNLEEVEMLLEEGQNFDYARRLADRGFYLNDILIFSTIGVNLEDTEKPNLVITFPFSDKIGRPFARYTLLNFLEPLAEDYDLSPFLVRNVPEVKEAIYSNDEIEALILFGHGNRTSILLERGEGFRERIRMNDSRICEYINHLNENAVIYLGSCLNGKGGSSAENLANRLMDCAEGRRIIAALDSFVPNQVRINSTYPLDLTILSRSGYYNSYPRRDLTYSGH